MDQDSTKGTDKRNWRERLGIGAGASSTPPGELPRIGDEFQKAKPVPAGKPGPSVKPAPMAPRPTPRAVGGAPVAPDRLADRLRSQRDAQAKLAEQRVQIARQRPTTQPAAPAPAPTIAKNPVSPPSVAPAQAPITVNAPAGAKPKFTFAEEDQAAAPAPAAVPPLTPARPPLGGQPQTPAFQPRPVAPTPPPAFTPPGVRTGAPGTTGYGQAGFPQQPYPQQQYPGYRPVDPATGYPPPPGYVPPRPFTPGAPAQAQNGFAPPPRFNPPNRSGLNPNYAPSGEMAGLPPQPGFGAPELRRSPRQAPPPRVAVPDGEADYGDDGLYAEPPPRASRRSAADYQQAYRDMENVYEEDEAPRSRGPWILLALLLLALGVAFGAVWFYQSSVKPMMSPTQTSTEQVPVVPAPAGQAKVQPEQPAPEAGGQAPIGKKRIYDRIVGDQEVLGGAISPTEEVPLAPAEGSSQVPDPATPAGEGTGQGLGDDSAPLPIPPPPGDGNTQGALPNGSEKQSVALNNPAADDSSAAVAVSGADVVPPAPGETVEPASANSEQEVINDAPAPAPVVEPKPAKKPAVKKTASKSLGSKPVVLVAPKKKAVAPAPEDEVAETTATVDEIAASDSNGLYGDSEATAQTAQPTPQPAPVKKKKTLADLFNNSDDDATAPQFQEEAPPAPAPTPKVTKPKPVAPAPAETQVASASGYAAQLASFRTREEASSEFSRLKSKHASILSGLSPVISQAEVAGSTRYRLSVGGMGSRDQASALCAKLLAAGERDCLVKRQ